MRRHIYLLTLSISLGAENVICELLLQQKIAFHACFENGNVHIILFEQFWPFNCCHTTEKKYTILFIVS